MILNRNDKDKDGKLSREEFPGSPELWGRLDANKDGFVTRDEHERAFPGRPAAAPAAAQELRYPPACFTSRRISSGTIPRPPPIRISSGALLTIYWSDVEPREGVFDWSDFDKRAAVWTRAGKKIAVRIMWSSSGNWPEPAAKHPTPQFVLDAGAVTVRSVSSKTDIPLFWDPIYRKYANRFLAEVARKFDGNPEHPLRRRNARRGDESVSLPPDQRQ